MCSNEDEIQPGHEFTTVDEVRVGDLVRFRQVPGKGAGKGDELEVVRLADLGESGEGLFRVFPGPEGLSLMSVEEPDGEIRTWESVRESGQRAQDRGSDWRRFGLPVEAIRVFSPGATLPPKRRLEDIEMPTEVRQQIDNLLSAAGKLPHPQEPMRVRVGLRIDPPGHSPEARLELLRQRFPVGAVIEISGLVSASATCEPPLYAAGAYGAMFDLLLADGAYVGVAEDEEELLLPMDCRCRIEREPAVDRFEIRDGGDLPRPCVRVSQIDSFAVG